MKNAASRPGHEQLSIRHGRACPGHPRLLFVAAKTWMPGTGPGMTMNIAQKENARGERAFSVV
jgi:hypothetical protein